MLGVADHPAVFLKDKAVLKKQISERQFGFLPNRSTTSQLVYIIDKSIKSLGEKQGTMAVFMNFRKAFDKVCHSGLLYKYKVCHSGLLNKLAACGMDGASTRWMTNYLTNRFITVRVGEVISDHQAITAGVPQGSIWARFYI